MASSQTAGETEQTVSEGGSGGEGDPAVDRVESGALEVVSVTDEDLPVVETPNTFNVSSFSSQRSRSIHFYDLETQDPHVPAELPTEASAPLPVYKTHNIQIPASPGVPIIKVQPFFAGGELSDLKSLCWPYVSRRLLALLITLALLIALILALGIGLGVGLRNCSGKFRCASSVRCIRRMAVCDGVEDCGDGEDELNCVRVSGRSSVLQVYSRGLWRTVCFDGWDSHLGSSAYSNCGSSPAVSSRIVGGNVSNPGQVPWQVSLYYQNQHLCVFRVGESSISLQTALVPLLSSRDCRRSGLTSWNICAGFLQGGAGACQGDNGGPLACRGSAWTLVGAASLAQSCGQKNKPGVYTSISQSLTWIHQQMEKEEDR